MSRFRSVAIILVLLAAIAGAAWWWLTQRETPDALVLYGNVELRQITLAFNGSGRIADILVEEGTTAEAGEVLARLETRYLLPQIAQAEAQAAAQRAALAALRNGSRPEEIAQARANLEAAQAQASNANRTLERQRTLVSGGSASQQALDQARTAAEVADAQMNVARTSLDLLVSGPRLEEIEQAEAGLAASEAQLDLLRVQLEDAELRAPVDAVVRSRLMEPGEMASASTPVFALAVMEPKWVRAYVSGDQLGRIRAGLRARVITDSFPDLPLDGRVGFISSVAEFTPRTVQTEELRTSLVYEIRVLVDDLDDLLRLGMPVTVRFPSLDGRQDGGGDG